MHVDHPDPEPGRRRNRPRDGVRDVVELQIEEHAVASRRELLDERRPLAGEQPAADLEAANDIPQAIRQAARVGRRIDVERD